MYTHVRSPLEIKRKQLEMNRQTAELKRAFYEYYLARNGDSLEAIGTADYLWTVVEAALRVSVEHANVLENISTFYSGCFAAIEKLKGIIPAPPGQE